MRRTSRGAGLSLLLLALPLTAAFSCQRKPAGTAPAPAKTATAPAVQYTPRPIPPTPTIPPGVKTPPPDLPG